MPPLPHQATPVRVSAKLGVPLGVLPARGPTARQVERMERINDGDLPRASTQQRPPQESPAQRTARKQSVKEERKVGYRSLPPHTHDP